MDEAEAELFKEFCRQYDVYALVVRRVLDNPGGYVKLLTDENGMIRKIEASRTFLII